MKNQPAHDQLNQRSKAGRVGPGRTDPAPPPKGIQRADAPRTEPSHIQGKARAKREKPN